MRRFALGLLLLALGFGFLHTLRGTWATARVERELAALDREGLLVRNPLASSESAELAAARTELERWMQWVREQQFENGKAIGCFVPRIREPEEIDRIVVERASFYEGLDSLPSILWDAEGAPLDGPDVSLMASRACTNTLDLRAWQIARDEGDGSAAGRLSARALAVARVRDKGTQISLAIRWSTMGMVVSNTEEMIKAGFAPARDLVLPLEAELRALQGDQRLSRIPGSELSSLRLHEREVPWTMRNWWRRPAVMGERLEFLETYGDHQRAGTYAELLIGEPLRWYGDTERFFPTSLPVLGEEHWESFDMWSFDEQHAKLVERFEELFESS